MVDAVDEALVGEHPRRGRRHQPEAEEADHVREQDRVAEAAERLVPAEVDPEQRQADHRELRVPVGPRRGRQQELRRVGDPLHAELEEVVGHMLLERDHAQAVHDGLGGVLVG